MNRPSRAFVAFGMSLALVTTACGDDDEEATRTTEPGATSPVRVTLTQTSLNLPDRIAGGVVTVEFDSQLEEGEVDFTKVRPGTQEQAFREGIAGLVAGGPVPEFMESNAGITATARGVSTQTIELTPGSYIAWAIPEEPEEEGGGEPSTTVAGGAGGQATTTTAGGGEEGGGGEEEGGPPPEAVVTKAFTVTEGAGGQLPSTDGTITARDYTFDVNVKAGQKFTFRNEGPTQLHHAIVFDFAKIDPRVVEEKLPAFLQSEEGAPPPPEFAGLNFDNLEAGSSGVFTPDGTGTFSASLQAGNTYAVVCFIHDRTGGAPHVFANDMKRVFTVT